MPPSHPRDWWITAAPDRLPPLAQAKVWGLHTAAKIKGWKLTDAEIATHVDKVISTKSLTAEAKKGTNAKEKQGTKTGKTAQDKRKETQGAKKKQGAKLGKTAQNFLKTKKDKQGKHPSPQAIGQLRSKIENDADWYPGKVEEDRKRPGPQSLFTTQKKQAVARCAMALKKKGVEPSVDEVVRKCPAATLNPNTGAPFSAKLIYEVFKTLCHDGNPSDPWGYMNPYKKTALSPELKVARVKWSQRLQGFGYDEAWFHQNVVWFDPCHTILTLSPRTAFDIQQASYGGGKRWMSKGARGSSRNLRASKFAGHQCRWGDRRVWWFMVVARGVVGYVVMGHEWTQNGEGMRAFVEELGTVLRKMLGPDARLPRVVFTDRGPGLYHSSTGYIVPEYKKALKDNGFRPFAGDDASWQPPDVPDLLMHDTAVSWTRKFAKKNPLPKNTDLNTQEESLCRLLNDCQKHINKNYDVASLCRSLPGRLAELQMNQGDRLKY